MAHALQERYSKLVDEKLRATLVTKDNLIFNNRYEGDPKAGMVKVPVRDTEVEVKKYDRQNGVDISAGSTTYFNLPIDNDEAVNEMIDGFEAAAVPDGIKAERLDSAGYSLGLSMDTKSIRALEETTGRNNWYHHCNHEDCLHRQYRIQGSFGCETDTVPNGRPERWTALADCFSGIYGSPAGG